MIVKPNTIFTKPLLLIAYIAVAGFSTSASAALVDWSFSGLVFNDGGTGSGSFTYDATTTTFTNVNVVTTNGTMPAGFIGKTYTTASLFGSTTELDFEGTGTIGDLLSLTLDAAMTDAGGTILMFASENNTTVGRNTGAQQVELSSVPVPAAVWLFGSGLLGLVGMARRKKA